MLHTQHTSIIDAFIALFKLLPAEAQQEIKQELTVEKTKLPINRKISLLKGKVTKINADEIDKQIKSLRDEWQRNI